MKFFTELYGYTQIIDSPTRITNHSRSLINLIFVDNPGAYINSGVFCASISDHFLIYAVRSSRNKLSTGRSQTHRNSEFRSFSKMNEREFVED